YAVLMWPLLGLAFLFWAGRGGGAGKWVPAVLCVVAAVAFLTNTGTGMVYGAKLRGSLSDIETEIRSGLPAEVIAARHFAGSVHEERAARAIPMLRADRGH